MQPRTRTVRAPCVPDNNERQQVGWRPRRSQQSVLWGRGASRVEAGWPRTCGYVQGRWVGDRCNGVAIGKGIK